MEALDLMRLVEGLAADALEHLYLTQIVGEGQSIDLGLASKTSVHLPALFIHVDPQIQFVDYKVKYSAKVSSTVSFFCRMQVTLFE